MKAVNLLIIGMFVFVLVGCTGGQDPSKIPVKIEFNKGTEGLQINLLKGLPPPSILEKSEFEIGIELTNKGSGDIDVGQILIVGLDPKYTAIDKTYAFFSLPGKSFDYPEGGYELVTFRARNVWFPLGRKQLDIPFTIIADYDYETKGSAEVCINPDIYGFVKTEEIGCETKDVSVSGGQGAPLAMTLIEPGISIYPESQSLRVRFGIYIENKGSGEVLEEIDINRAALGSKRMRCSDLRKENDRKWFTSCTITLQQTPVAFISPLSISFSYTYREKIDKKVTIKSIS